MDSVLDRWRCLAFVLVLVPAISLASPHVTGFERFHAGAPTAEGGAVLFSELGCANCHGDSAVVVPRQGPNLADLSIRVERDWVEGFLRDPESGRKGSTMPSLLHGLAEDEVDDVIAWLGSLRTKLTLKKQRHANAERGSALYHEKGCVACHAPTPDFRGPHGNGEGFDASLAVAHPDLKKKTSLEALHHFLSDPSRYRPDGRMPHLALEGEDAIDLAAHLIDFQASDPREAKSVTAWPAAGEGSLERGEAIARTANCAACHDLPGIEKAEIVKLTGPPARDTGHCLSAEPVPGLPHYDLTEAQRDSLEAFLAGPRPERDEDGGLTLAAMNCYACHERDGKGGPTPATNPFFTGDESLGDSGRLAPPLTGIGAKLRGEWLEGVLSGDAEHRVRPYLATGMPAYRDHAAALAGWFAEIDARPDEATLSLRDEDLEAGRKLLGIVGGVNCITCHHWGENRSLGIPAVDLASLDRRLRPEWFRSYLLDPASYRPGTLMPPLWPGGQSTVPDLLGGDAERQIAAIWNFIAKGEGAPEGFPDRSGGKFELVPEDRPVIQRTFLEKAGAKAVLVGFPAGVHLAYDGAAARPSLVWRGRFFDAYNTWFTRAAPFENPLGDDVSEFAPSSEEGRFLGYRLDPEGNPTFLSERGGRKIEESFRAEPGALVRTMKWSEGAPPAVTHPEGMSVEEKPGENALTWIYRWK